MRPNAPDCMARKQSGTKPNLVAKILATKFGFAVWYKTKFGSQNFGYQIWFCTRLLNKVKQ